MVSAWMGTERGVPPPTTLCLAQAGVPTARLGNAQGDCKRIRALHAEEQKEQRGKGKKGDERAGASGSKAGGSSGSSGKGKAAESSSGVGGSNRVGGEVD